jgi:hypothetical protein
MTANTGPVQETDVWFTRLPGAGFGFGLVAYLLRFLDVGFDAEPLVLPLWTILLPPVVSVVLWLLLRRRMPEGTSALAVGVPLLALVVAVAVPAFLPAPSPPPGSPAELAQLPPGPVLPADADAVVVYRDPDGSTPVTVEFADIDTINGLWSYSAGTVLAPGIAAVAPGRAPDWGDTISTSSDGHRPVTPTMDVELPLPPEADHTTITVTAGMKLTYPGGGFGSFVEIDEPLTREIRLFVGTPDERAFGEGMTAWLQDRAVLEHYPLGLAAAFVIGSLYTGVGLRQLTQSRRP